MGREGASEALEPEKRGRGCDSSSTCKLGT
jgi:hypothetical protein